MTHSYAALAFYTGGRARVDQRGAWTLGPGDVMLVPAGHPHRTLEAHRAEFWTLGVCVPCFAATDAAALLEPFERVRDGAAAVAKIPSERHEFLESLLRELEAVTRAPGPGGSQDAVQRSLLTLALAEIERATRPLARPEAPSSVVVAALRHIERHCLGPLTLAEVAAAIGRSPAHVTTSLSRATGRSAVQWIISGRMAEARRRLLYTDERVEAIAARVGYADATHFIRTFRRAHARTPAAWRANQRAAPRARSKPSPI